MTAEQALVLGCVSSELTGTQLNMEAFAGCDWDALLLEARQQSVLLHVAGILAQKTEVPEQIRKECEKLAFSITSKNLRAEYSQKQLVKLLEEQGIDYLILKGEASNAYYPVAGTRQMGDVDFIVKKKDLERTAQLLADSGFERIIEEHEHHQVFRKGKASLEMHSCLAGAPEGKLGLMVEQFADQYFDRGETKPFHAPAPELHGLILLLHMQHHMIEQGIGLRHLADWACYVQKTAHEDFWEKDLLPFLGKIGLRIYDEAMTAAANRCFGTVCPSWVQTDRALTEEVVEDLLSSGNFGRKDQIRSFSGKMIGKRKNRFLNYYDALKNTVLDQKPQLKDQKLLLGVHMAGKGFQYLIKSAKGERPKLTATAATASKRIKLYSKLQIIQK